MTLASRCWWRGAGLKVMGGLLILVGVLLLMAAKLVANRYAEGGFVAGLIIVALGTLTIVIDSMAAGTT